MKYKKKYIERLEDEKRSCQHRTFNLIYGNKGSSL